ncbi:MAG: FkbM family methyltransferase [Dysgonomonas sp.]
MLINNAYITQRLEQLIKEKQESKQIERDKADKLYNIKMLFPKWLRNIVFHPLNPFYSVFVQYKASKRKQKNYINIHPLHPFAVDFIQYYLHNSFVIDTELYFPKEDEETIISYIDNRLKSIIQGYTQLLLNKEQIEMKKKAKALSAKVKNDGDSYVLSLNGNKYYLPQNTFEEHTYIHEYGLKYLPKYIREYIKGKDFLDVGAYLGDTSIFLLKNYSPNIIYAYEPVKENAKQLSDTVKKNNTDKIIVVEKGLGEKEEDIDIYIDPKKLSGSSINSSVSNSSTETKRIRISTVDNECQDKEIGLIKMDVEGAEYAVIKGALETIKRDKPVLLISIYHTGKDFFEIAPLLKQTVPDYLFRIINLELASPFTEKILVAYPKSKGN